MTFPVISSFLVSRVLSKRLTTLSSRSLRATWHSSGLSSSPTRPSESFLMHFLFDDVKTDSANQIPQEQIPGKEADVPI